MKSQTLCLFLLSFLLVCGMVRGAEKPQPDPKGAMEKAVAAQKEWSQSIGSAVEITNSIGMKLALIPPGEFLMGSPVAEDYRDYNETQQWVQITKAFYLGVYEVTQSEYERVMGRNAASAAIRHSVGGSLAVASLVRLGSFGKKVSDLPGAKVAKTFGIARSPKLLASSATTLIPRTVLTRPTSPAGRLRCADANGQETLPLLFLRMSHG